MSRGRRWTRIEEEQIRWLAERGMNCADIGREIGRPLSSIYLKVALMGLEPQKRVSKYYPLTDQSTWDIADRICAFANVPLPLARMVVEYSHKHELSVKTVRSSCRKQDVFKCRLAIIAAAKEKGYSSVLIGRALNRDHTTIIHALRVIEQSPESTTSQALGAGYADYRIAA